MRGSLPAGPESRRRPSHLKGFLRLLPFLLTAMGLVWIALDGLIFRESARHMRDLERVSAIHRNYREATDAAGLLKAGSDALTQAVRRYAATGRPSFLHAYEQEEHVDRHRKRALEIIERMPGADDHARRMLRTSMTESLALQDVEHRAMRLVAEATGVPREEMPEHLQAVVLSPDEEALDAEKMKFSSAPCDFPALLFRVAGTFRFQVEQKGLALRVAAAPMPRLMLDEERVRQILVNLVSNAVKFTDEGSVEISADWTPAADGASGSLRFSVRDTGCGIAPEDQPRVLEPFVQVGQSGTGGTGLGLPICQRLLVRMGGELRLESEPGKGSTFTGLLHAVAVAPDLPSPASSASTDSTAPTAPTAPTASTASHPVRSALVVDDVPVNLLVEKAMLQRAGVAEIVTAPSGTAALEALEKHGAFDVVLTDLWMPEMDGYALCAHLRADERWKKLPVYAVTADVEARKVARERGFDGLLLKPVTTESLAGFLGSFRAPTGA